MNDILFIKDKFFASEIEEKGTWKLVLTWNLKRTIFRKQLHHFNFIITSFYFITSWIKKLFIQRKSLTGNFEPKVMVLSSEMTETK